MSQPDSNSPSKTNASAGKPADPKASAKAGANKGPNSGSSQSFWYVILFLVVAAVFAGVWVQKNATDQRPVVSAAEEENVVVAPDAEGESSSTAAALVVTSDVRGADVYLNGNRVGKTPHKATPLPPGDYEIKVVHEGYETFEQQVQVQTQDDSVHAALRPMSAGNGAGEEEAATPTPPADIRALAETVAVKHKHRIGSCEGVLRASDDGVRYETEHKDAFFAAYADIEELNLNGNKLTVKVRDVRKYDFSEPNDNQDALAAFQARVDPALPMTESADK